MNRRTRLPLVAVALLIAAVSWFSVVPSGAQEKKGPPSKAGAQAKPDAKAPEAGKMALKTFMRNKLESSQSIVEGLALEDFDLIAKGARDLQTTCKAAEFRVHNDPLYAQHTDEFRRAVDKIERAAKEKRIDGATLGFMDMTMSCVECHKFVRSIKIVN